MSDPSDPALDAAFTAFNDRLGADEGDISWDAAIAAACAAWDAAQWRPIAEAPRDGKTVWCHNAKMAQRGMAHWNGEAWQMVNGLTNYPVKGATFQPTHFRPLPPDPEDKP